MRKPEEGEGFNPETLTLGCEGRPLEALISFSFGSAKGLITWRRNDGNVWCVWKIS